VYVQDKVELVRDGSNVSLGLRWDFLDPTAQRPIVELIPVSQVEYQQNLTGMAEARFKQQISPRISLAVPAGPTTYFFANFGHYFQFPLFDYLYSGINPAQLRFGARNVLTGNPDLEPERTVSWEIGFKHGISENIVGSITYFRKNFKNQIDSKTLVPFDSKAAGDYGFASFVNNAEADASGLEFVLSRERDERLSGSISYSYMITEGVSEVADQTINYAQWGFPLVPKPFPLSWDQRHTVKVDAEVKLPFEIQSNVIVLYNSPRPYTYYPTRDGFTPLNPSISFIPNNRRMQDIVFVNLKLSRQFALGEADRYLLTVYADARNSLNTENVRWMDSSGRIGGELGDPGAYYDPRRVRVGVRMEF
jgi:outer membrane receptor protein involved in Fe transport